MTDGGNLRSAGQRSPAAVEVRVAARLENLAVLRTLVGAVGTFSDLNFDSVADLRLAVDEACTRLIRSADPDATLTVVVDPQEDIVLVEASAPCGDDDVVTHGSFSWHVLTSLVEDVQTVRDGDIFGIVLTMGRAGASR